MLEEINEYLAFKPWAISPLNIENLIHAEDSKLSWSVPEIMEAGSILATYHSLCGLVFG